MAFITPTKIDSKPQIKSIVLKKDILKIKREKYNFTKKKVKTIFGNIVKNIVTTVGEPS